MPERPDGAERSILLIDDDGELCALMEEYFSGQGFHLESVRDGPRGLARVFEGGFDLVLLDVMLPVVDGFEILRQIRRRSTVPVIMLTARTEERDRIAGLNEGADDYLPKPFGPDELLARIRAVLRRTGRPVSAKAGMIEAGGVRVNPRTHEVWSGDTPVELTSIEFDIFDLLVRAAGRAVSRDEIAAVLYHREATPYERSVDVHLSHLRKKLESGGPPLIRTVRGVG
jgi:two-component system, OmpR family, response regulator CpxR